MRNVRAYSYLFFSALFFTAVLHDVASFHLKKAIISRQRKTKRTRLFSTGSKNFNRRDLIFSFLGGGMVSFSSGPGIMANNAAAVETVVDRSTPSSNITNLPPPLLSLWIDTDPSGLVWSGLDCDDDLAVLVALSLHRRRLLNLEGISICGGNAPLQHTWPDIQRLLDYTYTGEDEEKFLRPVQGYGWRDMQVAWKSMRKYNVLFPDTPSNKDAVEKFVELSKFHAAAAENNGIPKLTILMLGPPTNLAKAIETGRLDPRGIEHVYLMGGELTGQPLDLNFKSDRASARVVLESELPTTIIPIQTCGQTSVTDEYLDKYLTSQCNSNNPNMAACALLPKMKQQTKVMPKLVNPYVKRKLLGGDTAETQSEEEEASSSTKSRWIPSPNLDKGFVPWDVVALLAIIFPDELFDEWEYHRVALPTCGGGGKDSEPCDQTMTVLENYGSRPPWDNTDDADVNINWRGVVRVPHVVRDERALLQAMFEYMTDIPAAKPKPPPLYWGFVPKGVEMATRSTFDNSVIGL